MKQRLFTLFSTLVLLLALAIPVSADVVWGPDPDIWRLWPEYDAEKFAEDFGDQFTDYEGQLDGYEVKDKLYFWTYPGSGKVQRTIREIDPVYNGGKLECQHVYTDPEDGAWGYVGYYMGRAAWIYLTDPEDPVPPSFPQRASFQPGVGAVALLVAGVVLVTYILIKKLGGRKHET